MEEIDELRAKKVWFEKHTINIELVDGRVIMTPLEFYPSLANATDKERKSFRIFAHGTAIHFNDLDADFSIESLVNGRKELPSMTKLNKDSLRIKSK